ncbi:MFS transporter [Streptomyces sp. NPDC003077]|uniref:MFS transporter n=1 Tax=Streptomyces sp. NPDC003077 TaxID=3154443 RepID=UPI0033B7FF57
MRGTLLAANLGFFLVLNLSTAPNVALPPIRHHFGVTTGALTWVVNAYTLVFAGFLLPAGNLCDRVGARRVFAGGLLLVVLGSSACFLVPSWAGLLAAQAVSGLGAAAVTPSSLALVGTARTDPAGRARAVSSWSATGAVAVSAGPLLGGLLVTEFGWRAVFAPSAVCGLAVLGILGVIARRVRAAPPTGVSGFDAVGHGVTAAGLCTALTLLVAVPAARRESWPVLACLAAIVLVAVAGARARHRVRPLPALDLLRLPSVVPLVTIGLLVNLAFYGAVFVFSLRFAIGAGYDPWHTGLALLPMTATLVLSNLLAGRLTARGGGRGPMVGGAALGALGLASVAAADVRVPYAVVAGALFAVGMGCGLVVPAMTAVLLSTAPASRQGAASGLLTAGRQVGGVAGVSLFGSLLSGTAFAAGVRTAELAAAGALLLVAGLGLRSVGHRPPDEDTGARGRAGAHHPVSALLRARREPRRGLPPSGPPVHSRPSGTRPPRG